MEEIIKLTHSKEETMQLAKSIADKLPSGITLTFSGDLGAGKTTFVRGLAKGLNTKEVVQSPTFNIMKIYLKGDRPLIHIDAYRLADINNDIGLDEYIGYETGLTMIEWPMFIEKLLPKEAIYVELLRKDDESRLIKVTCLKEDLLEVLK